jgi:cytochrome P450
MSPPDRFGPGLPPRFDILSPGVSRDPYETYALLRQQAVLARAGPATWAVTRYAEIATLLRDRRLCHAVPKQFAERIGLDIGASEPAPVRALAFNPGLTRIVSSMDPPRHTVVRSLMTKALGRAAAEQAHSFRSMAETLTAAVVVNGRFDAVADLVYPLQFGFTAHLLGVPEADRQALFDQAVQLGRAIILLPFVAPERGNGERQARFLRHYFSALVRERQRKPRDDLVSRLLGIKHQGQALALDEVIDNAVFFLFVGFETSISLIARSLAAFARFPDAWARLRLDWQLANDAIEEVLRYDTPLQWISRIVAAPIEVAGRTLKPGRLVLLLLASGNRDPCQFAEPDVLDLSRRPNPHLSFGGGIHHCIGASLVREQTLVVLKCMADRCAELSLDAEPVAVAHPNVRTYSSIQLSATPI